MLMLATLSMLMYFLNHPLSMGLIILIQTLLTCLISGMFINTYWFSYILFLTFLGGLLVLFIYVSSLASNEMFFFSMKLFISMIIIIITLMLMLNYMNYNNNFIFNMEMKSLENKMLFFMNEFKFNLNKLYNSHNMFFMMLLIMYLFITLVAVVKLTNIMSGPIRNFN
uniref:NADH dehydrogenase subunit 6 n=1 Tax=Coptotriche turpinia TaxID=2984363 RepID=UPI002238A41B|nr:NADH dehydrogenase subunit 6 [Coptotriche turpinia]UYB79013.1 NADH dehydrogenase subunit 6 [Coptotriche turpinia]